MRKKPLKKQTEQQADISVIKTSKTQRAWKNVLLAMLITALAAAVIWLMFPPHFTETNDDMIMASFAYGYMGEYTSKLVFINILVGKFLKLCIQAFPRFPWYTLIQCAIVYASFTALTFLLLQKFGRQRAMIPIAFLFSFFGYEFFSSMQFTKTAASAVTAGILLMFYGVSESRKWYTCFIGGLYTFAGSLYRFRIFEMLLLLMFGVGLLLVWRALREKRWKEICRICIPFVLVLTICFGAYAFDRWIYGRSDGWEDFWSYNYLRDNLQNSRQDENHATGFPDYEENRALYESLNITENDYNLYCTGNFADTELFTRDVVESLVNAKGDKRINLDFLRSFIRIIGKGIISYNVFPALAIALLAAALSASKRRKDCLFLLLYEIGAFTGIQLYFFYRGRYLQARTDVSVIFAAVAILMLYATQIEALLPTRRKAAAFLAGASLLAVTPNYVAYYDRDRAELKDRANTEVHELISSDDTHFYLCFASWRYFPDKMYDAWYVGEKECGRNRSALGTWRVSTPTVIDKMARYGITNPYRDMINNDGVYLLCAESTNLNQVMTHLREHYDDTVYAYQVKLVEDRYPIYRVATGEPQLDVSGAVNGVGALHYSLSKRQQGGQLSMEGYLYADGTNSFASNIYIGVIEPGETERFYYTTQYQSDFTRDNMNGEYGSFRLSIPMPKEESVMNLYLQTETGFFVIPNLQTAADVQ